MRTRYLAAACLALGSISCSDAAAPEAKKAEHISFIKQAQTESKEVISDGFIQSDLGWGYDAIRGEFTRSCLNYSPRANGTYNSPHVTPHPGSGFAKQVSTVDVKDVKKSLGLSVNARASYGMYNGSMNASFSKSLDVDDQTLSLIFNYEGITDIYTADRPGNFESDLDVAGHPDQTGLNPIDFMRTCGDSWVQEVRKGGLFSLVVNIHFSTQAEKEAAAADLNFNYGTDIVSVNTKLKQSAESFSKHTSIDMLAFQRGGDVAALPKAFSGKIKIKNGEGKDVGSLASLNCGPDNMLACNTFMTEAMNYATKDFVNSVDKNPALLSYVVAPWSLDPGAPKLDDQSLPRAVITARTTLLTEYQNSSVVRNKADYIRHNLYLGGDANYKKLVDADYEAAGKNMDIIADNAQACFSFSHPATAAEQKKCTHLTESTTLPLPGGRKVVLRLVGLVDLGYDAYLNEDELDLKLPTQTKYGRTDFVKTKTPGMPVGDSDTQYLTWGEWVGAVGRNEQTFTMCPKGQFAYGIAMRTEDYQGKDGDDTGLNWVKLACGDWDRTHTSVISPAFPEDGDGKTWKIWGTWDPMESCDAGPLTGVNVEIEAYQGKKGDDTGVDRVTGFCANGDEIQPEGGQDWGEPGTPARCPDGTAVCGLDIKYEPYQGKDGDDTAMTQIAIACCAVE